MLKKYLKVTYIAPLSLVIAMIGFILTLKTHNEFLKFTHAFFEAAMIGGLADWFAVVALFRHPMNIPIPHTSIIKKNRQRITGRIVDSLQNQWLTKEAISKKIAGYDFSREIAGFIESEKKNEQIRKFSDGLISSVIEKIKRSDTPFMNFIETMNEALKNINIVEPALDALEKNLGRIKLLILEEVENWLVKPEAAYIIKEKIRNVVINYAQKFEIVKTAVEFGESLGVLNYEYVTGELVKTLLSEIAAAKEDQDHEINRQLDKVFKNILDRLKSNEKLEALPNMLFVMVAGKLNLSEMLFGHVEKNRAGLLNFIEDMISFYADRLKTDGPANVKFNEWLRDQIIKFVNRNHDEIGKIVRENIELIDDDELVSQIEEKVGEDLQYIRINGAIVGGLVGTIIYAFQNFILR